ncbi:MAG: hypothetical protein HFACDABA_01948 [Anaerolineales bacterium]|nr:hypothetical protein [Anaerolineales bacterium]
MPEMTLLETVFSLANHLFDVAFLWGGIVLLVVAYPTYLFASNLKKYVREHREQELVSQAFLAALIGAGIALVWSLADLIYYVFSKPPTPAATALAWSELSWLFSSIRWLFLCLGLFAFAFIWGREHGSKRWLISVIGHIAIILIGWASGFWMGLFFVSAPILATYYAALYSLSTIILPASDPESREEKRQKFYTLASYTWGIQSPMTVVDGHAWKRYSPRITGDITWEFADYPIPLLNRLLRNGVVWTRAHQVVAISGGNQFKRVAGPGMVFPGRLERPDQVIDLRLQLRSREIEAVSRDGIGFQVRYFTAFRIDNQEWSKEQYETLRRMNPILRGADKLTNITGNFPYSPQRVQAALGLASTKTEAGAPPIYWDQCVMNLVEGETRQVIKKMNLDEMWRPALDTPLVNAMELIAHEIKRNVETTLRASGILLLVARVVDFKIPAKEEQEDDITRQHLKTWGAEWETKRQKILADAEAESEKVQQQARADAEREILTAIADGLKATQKINEDLPQHVIAMRFLSSLEDIHDELMEGENKDGEEDEGKAIDLKRRDRLTRFFKDWNDVFFANRNREK